MSFSNFGKSAAYTFLLSIIGFFIRFFISIFTARILAPADFGAVAFITAILFLTLCCKEYGLEAFVVRAYDRGDERSIREAIKLNKLIILILCAIGAPISYICISEPRLFYIYLLMLLPQVIASVHVYKKSVLIIKKQYLKISKIDFIATVLSSLVGLTLAIIGFGIWSLVAAAIVRVIVWPMLTININLQMLNIEVKGYKRNSFSAHAKSMLANNFFTRIYENAESLCFQGQFGEVKLGEYRQATGLAGLFSSITQGLVSGVIAPHLRNNHSVNYRLDEESTIMVSGLVYISFMISTILWIFSADIILLVYGQKWLGSAAYLQLLSTIIPVGFISGVLSAVYIFMGRHKYVSSARVRAVIVSCVFLLASLVIEAKPLWFAYLLIFYTCLYHLLILKGNVTIYALLFIRPIKTALIASVLLLCSHYLYFDLAGYYFIWEILLIVVLFLFLVSLFDSSLRRFFKKKLYD